MIADRPKEELKQIAIDIQAGHVFTDRHIPESERTLVSTIFMVIMFMEQKDKEQFSDSGMIFEYISKSLPRSINGMPMFTSMSMLNRDDAKWVWKKVEEIEETLKNL